MWKQFTVQGNTVYLDILPKKNEMTPVEASKKKNEGTAYFNLHGDMQQSPSKPKFKIGDKVRISKWKHVFQKGYLPNWSEELFVVNKIQYTNPIN